MDRSRAVSKTSILLADIDIFPFGLGIGPSLVHVMANVGKRR